MASKTSTSGADTPTKPPAEPKANDNDDAPNNSIKNIYKQSKPGINSAHKAAPLPNQPLPIREAPQNAKKSSAATGHNRNKSDDSTSSSMQVSPSDRGEGPSREDSLEPDPRRDKEGTEDTRYVGSIFQARTSPKKK